MVVVPGIAALRCAARLAAPNLAEVVVERIGEAIGHGLRRRREVISVPGAAIASRRAARELFRKVRRAMQETAPKIPERDAPPMPLAGKSAGTD